MHQTFTCREFQQINLAMSFDRTNPQASTSPEGLQYISRRKAVQVFHVRDLCLGYTQTKAQDFRADLNRSGFSAA